MEKSLLHRDIFYQRLPVLGAEAKFITSSQSGSVIITHAKLPEFKGSGKSQPYAVLGLCTKGGGRTRKETNEMVFENVWTPGKVGFALPSPAAKGFTPQMESLAIAFKPDDIVYSHGEAFDLMELSSLNHQIFNDDLISAVMIAMLKDAEAHGAATAFFDHGLSLILNRLKKHAALPHQKTVQQLPNSPINEVYDYIEDKLGDDIRVTELAQLLGVSNQTFTRLLKKETGYTPFMYLTKRRIERAKELLKADYSITEIAISVGYENPAKFAAAFRRWENSSPSEWRKRNRTHSLNLYSTD